MEKQAWESEYWEPFLRWCGPFDLSSKDVLEGTDFGPTMREEEVPVDVVAKGHYWVVCFLLKKSDRWFKKAWVGRVKRSLLRYNSRITP